MDLVIGTPQVAVVLPAPPVPVVAARIDVPVVLAAVAVLVVSAVPVVPVVGSVTGGRGAGDDGTGCCEPVTWDEELVWVAGDLVMMGGA